MVEVDFNAASKKVSFKPEDLNHLEEQEKLSAMTTADLVNRLMTDLVSHEGDVPQNNEVSRNITVASAKIIQNGVKANQQGKPEEAIKLLSTAMEMILRRPYWEPTIQLLEETAACLGARCDAYFSAQRFADAYADASLLSIIKGQDPMNFYRKGMCLAVAGRKEEARMLLQNAVEADPRNLNFRAGLTAVKNLQ